MVPTTIGSPSNSAASKVTSPGNWLPSLRWHCHSNRATPVRIASCARGVISSTEGVPHGCTGGESIAGLLPMNSSRV